MCINTRFIRNKYSGQTILVECGHCPACKQKRANKLTSRIHYAAHDALANGRVNVIITLTYDPQSVPYIRVSDLLKYMHSDSMFSYDMPVYRDSTYVREFGNVVRKNKTVRLSDRVLPPSLGLHYTFKTFNRIHLNQSKGYGKIGIINYKDVQDFQKRVLSVLRRCESPYKVKWFTTAEYGETYYRPHFHVLAEIPADRYEHFFSVVRKCWKMHDWDSPYARRRYELARDCASYVASYVNSPVGLPDWLSTLFPPKHSFSLFYGYQSHLFSYDEVKARIDRGNLQLPIMFDKSRGDMSLRCYPAHIVGRYYPLIKGLCRLTPDEILECVGCPQRLRKYASRLEYTNDELRDNMSRLRRGRNRCHLISDDPSAEYARDYIRAWSVWRLTILRQWYEDCEQGVLSLDEQFDNYHHLLTYANHRRLPAYGLSDDTIIKLPNEQQHRICSTTHLTEKYQKKRKQRKVASTLYSDGTSIPTLLT